MLKWRGPGVCERSRPFQFRGCDLTAEWLPATEQVRVQFPAAAPVQSHRLRVSTRPSFQNSAHSGRHGGSLPISNVESRISNDESPTVRHSCRRDSTTSFAIRHSPFVIRHSEFVPGSWQTSNAPALQAGRCGSVTRRLHHFQTRNSEPGTRSDTPTPIVFGFPRFVFRVLRSPAGRMRFGRAS